MPSIKARFVTACQQLLALGLVLAALTPAANLVSLEVVQREPGQERQVSMLAAHAFRSASAVPVVREISLTAPSARSGLFVVGALPAQVVRVRTGGSELVSTAQHVSGDGAVGLTWERGVRTGQGDIAVQVRTQRAGTWTRWTVLRHDAARGPEVRSEEARQARPGTQALPVGGVDSVQVRVTTSEGSAPTDLRLAITDAS